MFSHAVHLLGPLSTNQGLIREAEPPEVIWNQGVIVRSWPYIGLDAGYTVCERQFLWNMVQWPEVCMAGSQEGKNGHEAGKSMDTLERARQPGSTRMTWNLRWALSASSSPNLMGYVRNLQEKPVPFLIRSWRSWRRRSDGSGRSFRAAAASR